MDGMTPFKGPRLATKSFGKGDTKMKSTGSFGNRDLESSGMEADQMAPVNRRNRTSRSQGGGAMDGVNFKGYGPVSRKG